MHGQRRVLHGGMAGDRMSGSGPRRLLVAWQRPQEASHQFFLETEVKDLPHLINKEEFRT